MTTADWYTEGTVETVARILDAAHRRDHSWHGLEWRDFAGDARDVLDALVAAGWQPPVRHGDPRMLAAVYGADLGYDQGVQDILREMAESGQLCDTCAPVLTAAADDYAARVARRRDGSHLRRWAAEVRAGTRTIPPAERSST